MNPDCRHNSITVYMEENGPGRMWACSDCKIRFYPACRVCVNIGHRNEKHETIINEEQLAKALQKALMNQKQIGLGS